MEKVYSRQEEVYHKFYKHEYRITKERPPVADEAEKRFGVGFSRGTIFAYSPNIHDASGKVLEDLVVHELVHFEQQAEVGGPVNWWKIYFSDKEQRFKWEVEAYQIQFHWIKENWSRKVYFERLKTSSRQLMTMYGLTITEEEARALIMNGESYPQSA